MDRQPELTLRAILLERLAEHDRDGAVEAALTAVRNGELSIQDLYMGVLAPVLVEEGTEWQRGGLQVWQEHYSTAVLRTIVESLWEDVRAAAFTVMPNGLTAILATPSEESHELGLRMLADLMRLAGWKVHYLGADTPALQIANAARDLEADLIALSVATHYSRALLRDQIDEVKLRVPGVRVGVGGPAFAKDKEWPADELLTLEDLGVSGHPDHPTHRSNEE